MIYRFNTLLDIPLNMQSDLGSENYGIANAQTILRQWNDHHLEEDSSTLMDA